MYLICRFNDDFNQMVASALEHQLKEEFNDEYPNSIIHSM